MGTNQMSTPRYPLRKMIASRMYGMVTVIPTMPISRALINDTSGV